MIDVLTPKKLIAVLTPKESNVYSKLTLRLPYDSFGVEYMFVHLNSYKHAIPLGLVFHKVQNDNYFPKYGNVLE
jgi:hypothetical protein